MCFIGALHWRRMSAHVQGLGGGYSYAGGCLPRRSAGFRRSLVSGRNTARRRVLQGRRGTEAAAADAAEVESAGAGEASPVSDVKRLRTLVAKVNAAPASYAERTDVLMADPRVAAFFATEEGEAFLSLVNTTFPFENSESRYVCIAQWMTTAFTPALWAFVILRMYLGSLVLAKHSL